MQSTHMDIYCKHLNSSFAVSRPSGRVVRSHMQLDILGSWPLEIVIRWGKPYLGRLDEYPRKPKYPAM
jgi:hypothetical protein